MSATQFLSRSIMSAGFVMAGTVYAWAATGDGFEEGAVAARQSVDAYTSIEDAQPGDPGHLELQLDVGSDLFAEPHETAVNVVPELKYTGVGNAFLENMQLQISPEFTVGAGAENGNGDLTLGWQQRWVTEDGTMPTLGTLLQVRVPTGYHSSGVDVSLTGILDKDIGPGTAYASAFILAANGNNGDEDLRHTQWGFETGYKWRLTDRFALIGNYVHQTSDSEDGHAANLLEFAGEYHVNDSLSIGPGVQFNVDNKDDARDFGAGVRLSYGF